MNQNLTNNGLSNPSYIPNQSTYPPYMNIPGYNSTTNNGVNNNTNSTNVDPQYAESLFALNHGKKVTVYFSYPDSIEWRDRAFTGTILAAGRDYLLLINDQGQTILLWLVYINFAIFDEEISF